MDGSNDESGGGATRPLPGDGGNDGSRRYVGVHKVQMEGEYEASYSPVWLKRSFEKRDSNLHFSWSWKNIKTATV